MTSSRDLFESQKVPKLSDGGSTFKSLSLHPSFPPFKDATYLWTSEVLLGPVHLIRLPGPFTPFKAPFRYNTPLQDPHLRPVS